MIWAQVMNTSISFNISVRCGPPEKVSFSRHSGQLHVNVSWPTEEKKLIEYYSVRYKPAGSILWSEVSKRIWLASLTSPPTDLFLNSALLFMMLDIIPWMPLTPDNSRVSACINGACSRWFSLEMSDQGVIIIVDQCIRLYFNLTYFYPYFIIPLNKSFGCSLLDSNTSALSWPLYRSLSLIKVTYNINTLIYCH